MIWLAGRELVCETAHPNRRCDPSTDGPVALTARGRKFVDTASSRPGSPSCGHLLADPVRATRHGMILGMTLKAGLAAVALLATFAQMWLAVHDLGAKIEQGHFDGRRVSRARAVTEFLSWTALASVAFGVLLTELH